MDPFEGIDVEIISNGEVLTLYNDPDDEPSHNPRVRQRYIEAVTGATFEVKIRVDHRFSLFSLGKNDAVQATVYYDSTHGYSKSLPIDPLSGFGGGVSCTFTRIYNFCPETRQWKSGATTFGALVTRETTTHVPSVADLEGLGMIAIALQRVHRVLRTGSPPEIIKTPSSVTEVSEKVLKGRAIANTIRASNERVSDGPGYGKYDHFPIQGEGGQPLKYNIFYRSRRTLQMLGCIPQSPSPSPSPVPTNHVNDGREQELRALRARLAKLEGTDTKAQGADSKTRIKREIGELEASDDIKVTATRSAKKSRSTRPVETIDLTAD
ncbi:hypothetical protein JMJ35_004677 [Cladonia borealis]|uniref:DUF7918 domain-containing protein n=1 Tax=Cladonia borealis TaxID=184061 RepID=A0AA39R2P4_9LECA|nr:hypothetical protein JMJ35_004677 [Cladonia borealis]